MPERKWWTGTYLCALACAALDLGRHQVSVDMRVEERAAQPQALVPSLREVPRQGADGAQVRSTQAETLRRHVSGDGGALRACTPSRGRHPATVVHRLRADGRWRAPVRAGEGRAERARAPGGSRGGQGGQPRRSRASDSASRRAAALARTHGAAKSSIAGPPRGPRRPVC